MAELSSKRLTVLGSTGSIGCNTLDVVSQHPDAYEVFALTAHSNVNLLAEQVRTYNPRYAVMKEESAAIALRELLGQKYSNTEVLSGNDALCDVASASEVDYVMAAIVGAAGLLPTLAAVKAGKRLLLANKEALVMSGNLFMQAVRDSGAELLPIDSEHNAIFQCLPQGENSDSLGRSVRKICLTASGGPFLDTPLEELDTVTPEQACKHPNWLMGRKISVDSASMMNKGLELIEACWLFDMPVSQVDILIHPQSVVHSLVEYSDGSMLAQLGNPDMRTPIAYGLGWPDRIESGVASLDLAEIATLNFRRLDQNRFPCVGLAIDAMQAGGSTTVALNAANEEAVSAFLDGRLAFTSIPWVIESVLERYQAETIESIDAVMREDLVARKLAQSIMRSYEN